MKIREHGREMVVPRQREVFERRRRPQHVVDADSNVLMVLLVAM
jgi:hypothetical protein